MSTNRVALREIKCEERVREKNTQYVLDARKSPPLSVLEDGEHRSRMHHPLYNALSETVSPRSGAKLVRTDRLYLMLS